MPIARPTASFSARPAQQPVVRRLVGEDEERVLLHADDDAPASSTHGLGQTQTPKTIASAMIANRLGDRGSERAGRTARSAARARRRSGCGAPPRCPRRRRAAASGRRSVRNSSPRRSTARHAPSRPASPAACRSCVPFSRPRNASGAAAMPSAMVSRYLSLPVATQRAELLQRLGPDLHVLADDEALDRQARLQDQLRLLQRDRLRRRSR